MYSNAADFDGVRIMIRKPRMISMRLTEDQYQTIQDMIKFIEVETGTKVTQSSLILKLIEFGRPILQQLYPRRQNIQLAAEDGKISEKKGIFRIFG
jgi:hypothetical protein